MTQFWLTNFCSSPFWHLKFLQPPIPLWETGEERERKKTGEGRGCSITLFCSTTKPPFSPVNLAHPLGKRKSQKGLHRIARNRDTEIKKKQKQKTGEEREKKNRGGTKLPFLLQFQMPLFLSFAHHALFWIPLCWGSNHIGGCWCRGNSPLPSTSSNSFFFLIKKNGLHKLQECGCQNLFSVARSTRHCRAEPRLCQGPFLVAGFGIQNGFRGWEEQ